MKQSFSITLFKDIYPTLLQYLSYQNFWKKCFLMMLLHSRLPFSPPLTLHSCSLHSSNALILLMPAHLGALGSLLCLLKNTAVIIISANWPLLFHTPSPLGLRDYWWPLFSISYGLCLFAFSSLRSIRGLCSPPHGFYSDTVLLTILDLPITDMLIFMFITPAPVSFLCWL